MCSKEINFIRDIFLREKVKRAIVAVSGGIDSAVALDLTVRALGAKNVFSLQLPYGQQSVSMSDLVLDFVRLARPNRRLINIQPAVDTFRVKDKQRLGNIMARVRMIYIYDLAKQLNALVVGTENKSEHLLGYYTRFGDAAADIEPLIHLYKTEVIQMAKELGLPEAVIAQIPTAGLWQGQTDEQELGFSYVAADAVLQGKKQDARVVKRLTQVEFKKRVPYTL